MHFYFGRMDMRINLVRKLSFNNIVNNFPIKDIIYGAQEFLNKSTNILAQFK